MQIQFQSISGTPVFGKIWAEVAQPKGVLQIIHGMSEHIDRYQEFALWLNQHGFIVGGHDHLGHGKTGRQAGQLGYFCEEGPTALIRDSQMMTEQLSQRYPQLPIILLGHSMGSFILRNVLQQPVNANVCGAILMGTGGRRKELALAQKLVQLPAKLAPTTVNQLLQELVFGSFQYYFPESSKNAWLSANHENVRTYEADPNSGFVFTNNGFATLFSLIMQGTEKGWGQKVPMIPYLVISGAQDPVGNMGKGPIETAKDLRDSKHHVRLQLYPEYRHEILNENHHELVYRDILAWMNQTLDQTQKSL